MSYHSAALSDFTQRVCDDPQLGAARRLVEAGHIKPWQLFYARQRLKGWDTTLCAILITKGWCNEHQVLLALAAEYQTRVVDLGQAPPDPRLKHLLRPEMCLRYSAVPWIEADGHLFIATSRPEQFERLRVLLPVHCRLPQMVLAPEAEIQALVAQIHAQHLTKSCETRVAKELSCRGWAQTLWLRIAWVGTIMATLIAGVSIAPTQSITALVILTLGFLLIGSTMKCLALTASRRARPALLQRKRKRAEKLPRISVLVPLFKETEIANALLKRLLTLTYPRALLDVVLVLEETDPLTRETLARTNLPNWIQVVIVPKGNGLTTKPRAMNYALDFCRGEIIGIWDAEDAPDPKQLETIAAHFAHAAPDVACVQGVLDYYNPDTNWISRCFTLEYSMWFRTILRGMSRMGAPIPLGGTTLFMRRDILEKIGRWDAHNVTEDADLGIRMTRFGYRTELSLTVTQEEANCRFRPWIRQRSRWLKGYMVTYLVHMRHPRALLKTLGWGKFIGLNVILLAALMQFLLAPVLWCFWFLAFGVAEPLGLTDLPPDLIGLSMITLGAVTLLDFAIAALSMRGQNRDRLIPWVFAFMLYFPMATLAAYKALFELIFVPFFWDKTTHGQTKEGQTAQFSAVST